MILVGSFVNTGLLIVILVHYLRAKKSIGWHTYFKTKPLILFLMILYESMSFIRYSFDFSDKEQYKFYTFLLIAQ